MLKKVGVVFTVICFLFILGCSSENLYLDYAVTADFPAEIDGETFLDNIESDADLAVLSSTFEEVTNPDTGEKRNQYTIAIFNKGDYNMILNEVSGFYCLDEKCDFEESVIILEDPVLESGEVRLILLASKLVPKRININYNLESEDISRDNMDTWYYSDVKF